MRIWIHIFKAPIRVVSITRKRQTVKLRRQLVRVKIALAQEKDETKEMLSIYRRYTIRQASPEEMKLANQQFLDVLKGFKPSLEGKLVPKQNAIKKSHAQWLSGIGTGAWFELYDLNSMHPKPLTVDRNGILLPKVSIAKQFKGNITFGYVGGNTPIKGSDLVLKAFSNVNKSKLLLFK